MKQALRDALNEREYTTLTPVQEAVLNPDLEGLDLLVSAQTGSGKTLAFGLAIAPVLLGEDEAFEPAGVPLALVIAPTRELALQVKRELAWLYAKAGAVVTSCVGGMDMRDERRALARGTHIVVATPGRLRDHIMRGSIDPTCLRSVVLDEADEMLDLGFREDLEFILGEAPQGRQTLLFSATVPKSILGLAKSYQRDAIRVVAKSEPAQHADIQYRAMLVAERDTENAVINILRFHEAPTSIVFANTRAMVNRLTTRLSNRGFQVVALSGEFSQAERTNALQSMRDGRARVCVATDVAARGIDLPNLELVVHAELPSNHETLLHRSGRTGRAGRKGVSALVVTKKSHKKAQRILSMANLKPEWGNAPSADAVLARDEERMLADPKWKELISETEASAVETLTFNFTAEQLAAAYLRLFRSTHTSPEELSDADAKPAPHPEFGSSVWFSVSGGRNAGAEPRRLLPALCKAGDVTRDDIGAIRIQQDQSFVQILEKSVPAFLKAIGPDMALEPGVILSQLSSPPKLEGATKAHRKTAPKTTKSVSTRPIDWNDDPAPRLKKPKPASKSKKPKSRNDTAAPGERNRKPESEVYRRADGDAPLQTSKPSKKRKGPPPPIGKPSSKKNRARALNAAITPGAARKAKSPGRKRSKT